MASPTLTPLKGYSGNQDVLIQCRRPGPELGSAAWKPGVLPRRCCTTLCHQAYLAWAALGRTMSRAALSPGYLERRTEYVRSSVLQISISEKQVRWTTLYMTLAGKPAPHQRWLHLSTPPGPSSRTVGCAVDVWAQIICRFHRRRCFVFHLDKTPTCNFSCTSIKMASG